MSKRLSSLKILEPCQERWEEMSGDDTRRYCERCEHSVTDLSTLTEKEAEAALVGGPLCIKMTRDAKGEIITRTSQHRSLVGVLQAFARKKT
jgi:hypothetical protein